MDMQFNTTKGWHKSLKQECMYGTSKRKGREEYQSIVKDTIVEAEWKYLNVNEQWHQMKNLMNETAQVTCGLSKGPCSHNET